MLQFNRNNATNKNAIYIETFNSSSGFYNSLVAVYSQSYDLSNGTFDLTTTSAPTTFRHWLVFNVSGSLIPSASGQYDISIFERGEGAEGTWGLTTDVWSTTTEKWATFGDGGPIGVAIYEDRAYIVGTNEDSIKQYLSPNENGSYITYNG